MISKSMFSKISLNKFARSSPINYLLVVFLFSILGGLLSGYLSSPLFSYIRLSYAQGLIPAEDIWKMFILLLVIQGLIIYIVTALTKQAVVQNHTHFFVYIALLMMVGLMFGQLFSIVV